MAKKRQPEPETPEETPEATPCNDVADETAAIVEALSRDRAPQVQSSLLLSTGSAMANLAVSGLVDGGIPGGTYVWFVGDSNTGKTWFAAAVLAEATINPAFDGYRLIYDGPEGGMQMDVEHFFGPALKARIEPPYGTREEPQHSSTTDDFYFRLDDLQKEGTPFVYVLDSMDALTTVQEVEKFTDQKDAARKGKQATGTYAVSKPKDNSARLRVVTNRLMENGSILIVISQTRDNIGFGSTFEPQRPSGGNALWFYATVWLWTSIRKKLTKTVNGKPRQIGTSIEVRCKRSRVTGKDRTVFVPIYPTHGIDDVGSMVDFLVEENHWAKPEKGGKITTTWDGVTGEREKIIASIIENGWEAALKEEVQAVWSEIEAKCAVVRKSRYHPE